MQLVELVEYLNHYLEPEPVKDVSVNGLQVPGAEIVNKIAVATDASIDSFEAAVEKHCNFLFVHHGIFWSYNREDRITPIKKKKLKFLFDNGLSLYASHLPLDLHPTCGNNQKLFELIGLKNRQTMGFYQGTSIGLMGDLDSPKSFNEFCADLETKLKDQLKTYQFSNKPVKKVAMITGQGQSGIPEAETAGFDTFITGEMNHYMYYVAKELQVNIILAGHYRTETLGPLAVGEHIKTQFGIDYEFLEFPTGL
tara:strand:- start:2847 stop:3605 length:759 start_codon:yes stop_codon:yes gene_type:complete